MLRMVVVVVAVGLVLCGCATATRTPNDRLHFETVPDQARVSVEAWYRGGTTDGIPPTEPLTVRDCVTPCFVEIPRNARLRVTVTAAGFHTEAFAMEPVTAGEVVLGSAMVSLTGALIDSASGAFLDHCPNPVRLQLRSLRGPARAPYDAAAACAALHKQRADRVNPDIPR